MKRVELLAPAGNYQAFLGALHAGADAVYLGGEQFSARAYADNFTEEEICKAIHHAHFYGKKVYLTVNTLLKDEEFDCLYEYISPFYEAGLDGIIVQDFGVWKYMRETFPDLPLHASTQMTITGRMGTAFLKELGASRIVPARELSLAELKTIKEETGMELECFIHGAMCYCYSGMCLFSSILGGRSGNRGRCAQPCRLPYRILEKDRLSDECYPLSLKDMCTIEYIPKLIEAGIDSFKIEGRMKKPEYTAGVTSIYRKYIDLYYENGTNGYYVEEADMDKLRKLYIRSEIQTGYYERSNGREMITLQRPGYLGSDDILLQEIADRFLREEERLSVTVKGEFCINQPAMLRIEGAGITQTSYGELVQSAVKHPMGEEAFLKQIRKTGNSHVRITAADITVEENAFMPVVQLNELRRTAVEAFEDKMIQSKGFLPHRERPKVFTEAERQSMQHTPEQFGIKPKLHVLVRTLEQLRAVCAYPCDRIYVESDFYLKNIDQVSQYFENCGSAEIYLALPYMLRGKDTVSMEKLFAGLHERIEGFLVRNLEALSTIISSPDIFSEYDIVTDAGLYCFNIHAADFFGNYCKECCLPYELNQKSCRQLIENSTQKLTMIAYGSIPMMISANCLKKTAGTCSKDNVQDSRQSNVYLKDRYQTDFPVLYNCEHCYNIIYNSIPYSLHLKQKELYRLGIYALRLDFVRESDRVVREILDYYVGRSDRFPLTEYTTGHYKRGVE